MRDVILFLLAAFVLDSLFGDPPYRFHPIRILGGSIGFVERVLRKLSVDGYFGGVLLALIVISSALAGYIVISSLLLFSKYMLILWNIFLVYSFLALGDLLKHAGPVLDALPSKDLQSARRALAMIVGREVTRLDEKGVVRATVETLAENFVDGFLSPVFWYLVGGLLGRLLGFPPPLAAVCSMLVFKTASTLDSMVGYNDERYERFGWAGARLDDAMNFMPARLSIGILMAGAWLSGLDALGGLRAAMRDRLKHDSPNAGHPESFVAGALGVRLGGPAVYGGKIKEKAWLGEGREAVNRTHIILTLSLLKRTAWVFMFTAIPLYLIQ